MAGTERSGNKPLGRYTMADELTSLRGKIDAIFPRDGRMDADKQLVLDDIADMILAEEMLGQKQALIVALCKDIGVIDRAKRLATDYADTFGPVTARYQGAPRPASAR